MVQIVLIRPGSTEYDEQGRIQGTLEIPLSAQGRTEVERLATELRPLQIDHLYSSACQPAWETAVNLAAALDVKLKKLDRMQNLDHGLWQGMLVEDVKRRQPKVYRQWQEQPEIICPPEGEMLSQALKRVDAALGRLLKKHKQGVVGIVLPEPLASLVRSYLTHSEVGDLWKSGCVCGSWEVLTVQEASAVAASGGETNGRKHLPIWRGLSMKAV